jgi:hypothetical protein
MCPHKNAFVLSRGIIGSAGETPKVSCPMHKRPFSLQTGESLSGEEFAVKVFPVKIEADEVYLLLPPKAQLDALLATDLHCVRDCSASDVADRLLISASCDPESLVALRSADSSSR